MITGGIEKYFLVVFLVIISVASGKIDVKGGILGGIIAALLLTSIGYWGVLMIGLFFGLGTAASLYKISIKRQWGISEGRRGKRGWRNVLSNSGVAGLLAFVDVVAPGLVRDDGLLIAACFASALSDTLSSEMGSVRGKDFYHVLTWKPAQRGRDGVVSLEGTGWGIAGSLVMAFIYAFMSGGSHGVGVVAFAGVAGNVMDSVLGATVQQSGKLDNHGVNFVSTAFATGITFLFTFW